MIISVGYRVKSNRGIVFRKWANNVLKQYLLKGYVIDGDRVTVSKESFLELEMKRNVDRFPKDFCFQLTAKEFDSILRSQNVTLNTISSKKKIQPLSNA